MDRQARALALGAILTASFVFLLLLSHTKLIWGDESLTWFTLHGRTAAGLIEFQRTTPIVLEPVTHDLLLWVDTRVLGYSLLALRLPAMVSFLFSQWLLYRIVTTAGGVRAGLCAAMLALVSQWSAYGAEARPYAFLTALTLAAIFAWMKRRDDPAWNNTSLVLLFVALSLACTSQWFGFLAVLPVIVAELVEMQLASRRLDRALLATLVLGALTAALDIPFIKGAGAYRASSSGRFGFSRNILPATYEWCFFDFPRQLRHFHLPFLFWVFLLAFTFRQSSAMVKTTSPLAGTRSLRWGLWASLFTLVLFPLPALLLGYFVTHIYFPRYAIQCGAGVAGLLGLAVAQVTRRLRGRTAVAWGIAGGLLGFALALRMVVQQKHTANAVHREYAVSPEIRSFLDSHPGEPIYTSIDVCLLYPFEGDQEYASRIRCVQSRKLEMRFKNNVLSSQSAIVMGAHTDLPYPVVNFEQIRGQAILVYQDLPWLEWIPDGLKSVGATEVNVGTGMGGDVRLVQFPPAPAF